MREQLPSPLVQTPQIVLEQTWMQQSQEVVKRPGSTTAFIAPAPFAGVDPGVLASADQASMLVLPALGTLGVLRAKGAPEAISGLSIDLFWLNLLFF